MSGKEARSTLGRRRHPGFQSDPDGIRIAREMQALEPRPVSRMQRDGAFPQMEFLTMIHLARNTYGRKRKKGKD